MHDYIAGLINRFLGVSSETAALWTDDVMFLGALACIMLAYYLIQRIVIRALITFIMSNNITWDNVLLERRVFQRVFHLALGIAIYYCAALLIQFQVLVQRFAVAYCFIAILFVLTALLNVVDDIYRNSQVSKIRPIKGYIQVTKILIFIVGSILIIAELLGQSPLILLSGFGAVSAILLLLFKDTILGLVAGIQLATNDMVRIGDWIEMPKYGADGDVIEISLHTVKVQNWDKTVTTIPSYALVSDSFKNWRGMQDSGGRRIKRSVYIDKTSVFFCAEDMIERFKKIHYLKDYITKKQNEIDHYNREHGIDTSEPVNGRQITNIGTLRVYIENYLRNHPRIHKGMTLMVRQLQPTENGLPLEIYAFTNDIAWVNYEAIQADVFDHILSIIPHFGLRVFQVPSGHDMRVGLGTASPAQTLGQS
jgi:miniconductance mechanosensitive channel